MVLPQPHGRVRSPPSSHLPSDAAGGEVSRIRTLKPEILEDAVTAGLSDVAFRLFVACILLADDHGRLRAEPSWLRGQVYWSRDVDAAGLAGAMVELDGLLTFYTVSGQRYAEIRNWSKHQKVDKPGKPRIPSVDDGIRESLAEPSRDLRESLATGLGPRTIGPRTTDLVGTAPAEALPTPTVSGYKVVDEPEPKSKARRGTRLPADWTPSAETQAWARKRGLVNPAGDFLEEFREFWGSTPGARAVKLDWDATFKGRVRQKFPDPDSTPAPRMRAGAPRQGLGSAATAPWMDTSRNDGFEATE